MAEILGDYTFQVVALGAMILGMISGVLGCFVVLRKESLIGDGVSHGALPGVVFVFLLTGTKEIEWLLLGGLVWGLLTAFVVTQIVDHSKITFDGALAVVLSSFFGLGMLLLTLCQKIPNANQAGLEGFIYGQASVMLREEVLFLGYSSLVLLAVVCVLWKEWKVLTFDPSFAESMGLGKKWILGILHGSVVCCIVLGLQLVGVILMSALLIAPAVAARQWTSSLETMVLLSGIFGGVSGVVGTLCSSLLHGVPTGPVIVLCASGFAFSSLLFAPHRGVLWRWWQSKKRQQ